LSKRQIGALVVLQLELSMQPTHEPSDLQIGVEVDICIHWSLDEHGKQTLLVQIGVVLEQSELSLHWTHEPVVCKHFWLLGQSFSFITEHARHVFVVWSQIGVEPEQSEFIKHWTHLPRLTPVGEHFGVVVLIQS
jgi:hypothetical protein